MKRSAGGVGAVGLVIQPVDRRPRGREVLSQRDQWEKEAIAGDRRQICGGYKGGLVGLSKSECFRLAALGAYTGQ